MSVSSSFERPQSYFDYVNAAMTEDILESWTTPPAGCLAFSEQARAFVELCTQKEAHKRPTAVELLEHDWLRACKRDKELIGEWMDACASKAAMMPTQNLN